MRGGRGGRGDGGAGRATDVLRELRPLGVVDLVELDRPPGVPERVELAGGFGEDGGRFAVAAASRDGADLIGWAHVAAALRTGEGAPPALLVAAPSFLPGTRRAAERAAAAGAIVHLVAIPALAHAREIHAIESFPEPVARAGAPARSLLERVVRVLEGAVEMTGVGALRAIPGGYALYMRGHTVLRVAPGGGGVGLWLFEPDRRHVQVSEESFPRWGVELQETIVGTAQDPRLLRGSQAMLEEAAGRIADSVRARITGRTLAWSPFGDDPVEWVGIDSGGRPVLGAVRSAFALACVPGLLAALDAFHEQRELWAPGAQGRPRIVLAADEVEPKAKSLLAAIGLDVQVRSLEGRGDSRPSLDEEPRALAARPGAPEREEPERPSAERAGRDEAAAWEERDRAEPAHAGPLPERDHEEGREGRRGRRRGRRRRGRGRGEAREGGALPSEESAAAEETGAEVGPAPVPEVEPASAEPADADRALDALADRFDLAAEEPLAEEPPEEALAWEARGEPSVAAAEVEPAGDFEEGPEEGEFAEEGAPEADAAAERIDSEVAATLAEEPGAEPAPSLLPVRRVRRARAAVVVRDDPACVLAGLVLARDRRQVVQFWVSSQEALMDYFKTGATDLGENVDLLLVGFTAQPVPHETIRTAGLYRGRLQWFDHHEWPIEDSELLRDAIGRDSIVFVPGALGPLGAVAQVAERRSRFTDKLVELSAQRLSENDMQRWGNRVVALVRRLARGSGDRLRDIQAVLAGKPSELPDAPDVFAAESAWIESHDPRLVYFGEYPMVVVRVPGELDCGEIARRLRLRTGARLSLASREGDPIVLFGCNEEKRHLNALALVERLEGRLPWAHARPGGDRIGRLEIDELDRHPERLESLVGEIVRNKSVLYG
jgi:hypothetical protein